MQKKKLNESENQVEILANVLQTNIEKPRNVNIKTEDIGNIQFELYTTEDHKNDANANLPTNLCLICYKKCNSQAGLLRHIGHIHPERKDGNNSHKRNTRNKGLYIPTNSTFKQYECNICHKRYSWTNTLKQHIRKLHPDFKPHECSVCHKCYNTRHKLKNHMREVHTKNRLYKCKICGRDLSTRYNLEKHCLRHAGQHSCGICWKVFTQKGQLIEHLRLHRGKRLKDGETFECYICRKQFNKKNHLSVHLKMHKRRITINGQNNKVTRNKSTFKNEKRYECKICHKGFSRSTVLKIHTSLHGRNVPSKSNTDHKENDNVDDDDDDNCPASSVPLIVYIPAVEKVYTCDSCHKRFLLKTALRVHLQEHSIED